MSEILHFILLVLSGLTTEAVAMFTGFLAVIYLAMFATRFLIRIIN